MSEQQKNTVKEIWGWIRDIGICLLIAWFIITFIGQNTIVDGESMYPTLEHRDFVITNKLVYRFSEPKFQDIVVFPYKVNENSPFIKRVIGLPGDEIDIRDGKVYRNGEALEETYINEGPVEATGDTVFPVTVPEGEYFIMGDNRGVSYDSRFTKVGMIPKDKLIGRVKLRVWPPSKFGFIE